MSSLFGWMFESTCQFSHPHCAKEFLLFFFSLLCDSIFVKWILSLLENVFVFLSMKSCKDIITTALGWIPAISLNLDDDNDGD